MKVKFETMIDGINRYIDKEIYPGLNDVQEFVARLAVGRINQSAAAIKANLMNNGFFKTLCIIDSDGMVDVDDVLGMVKKEIERKGSISFEISMIGKMTFRPADVDLLRDYIGR
jgi:hypothetical protein